jgi:hypothetical protein
MLRSGRSKFKLAKPHLQNNQSKMDWRCGSSSKAPDLQARSPEFKLQSHQKIKTTTKNGLPQLSPNTQRADTWDQET